MMLMTGAPFYLFQNAREVGTSEQRKLKRYDSTGGMVFWIRTPAPENHVGLGRRVNIWAGERV